MRRKGRIIAFGVVATCATATVWIGTTIGWLFPLLLISTYTIVAGVIVIAFGLVARRGKHLTCARCGYRMGSFRASADRCAECGGEWRNPWHHTIGERRISWRLIGAGTVAILAGSTLQALAVMQVLH
jgi:ribosomal protein L37E